MEQLIAALSSIRTLRSNVSQVFYCLSNGIRADHGEENRENKYLLELQEILATINVNLREVEQNVNAIPTQPLSLGSPGLLAQETAPERQALYSDIVNIYKWTDRIHKQSNVAYALLSQNSLKRSNLSSTRAKRNKAIQPGAHNIPHQQVDAILTAIDRTYSDMKLTITRPLTSNAIVHVSLGNVLKAIIAFEGLVIERVVVRGYNESPDLWTESRYKVFRRVTDHAHSSMLHFYNPMMIELSVKSFLAWFHSYISLFSDPCKKCGLYLHSALPPTWRDQKTLEPYHFECKP